MVPIVGARDQSPRRHGYCFSILSPGRIRSESRAARGLLLPSSPCSATPPPPPPPPPPRHPPPGPARGGAGAPPPAPPLLFAPPPPAVLVPAGRRDHGGADARP